MPEFAMSLEELTAELVVVHVGGFLDAHTFEQMEEKIESLFDRGIHKVIVNLEKVNYISSAGCGVFIGAIGEAQDHGGDIVLLNPTPNVMEVFELLGLTQIFSFAKTVDEARGCFS